MVSQTVLRTREFCTHGSAEGNLFLKMLDLKCGLTCMIITQKQVVPHQADG